MLLPAETNTILKKKCCKKYVVRFFCSNGGKIIFALPTKIIADYMVITPINVNKAYFEKMFTRGFCNSGSNFYYCLNNVL